MDRPGSDASEARAPRRRGPALALAALLLAACATAPPEDRPWLAVESGHFTLYTEGPEGDARALVSELERFEAAARALLRLPAAGPGRSRIVAFGGLGTARPFLHRRDILAWAAATVDGGLVVTSASRDSLMAGEILRHEVLHVLLGRAGFRAPHWYQEGLAELLSTMQVGRGFVEVGHVPSRVEHLVGTDIGVGGDVTLRQLLSDDELPSLGQDPYAAAWWLTHYLLLGHPEKAPELEAYLGMWRVGTPSAEAFERAFHTSIERFEHDALRPYQQEVGIHGARRLPLALAPLDTRVTVRTAGRTEMGVVFSEIRTIVAAVRASKGDG